MKKEVEVLLNLIKENPELEIVPMVDYEVAADDGYNWWMGKWGKAEVDEVYITDERIYFMSVDYEDLVDSYIDDLCEEEVTVELEDEAMKAVDGYAWKKVIVVNIVVP